MSPPASTLVSTKHAESDHSRPCASFAPCIWGDTFLQYSSESMGVPDNNLRQQHQILKEEVKMMFQSSNQNITRQLNFINSVQRFGISYHFQQEINQSLEQIHNTYVKNNIIITQDENFHFLALLFRVLRQQGYQVSSSAFNKFKNEQGNFNQALAYDIQELCNLYEAAHLRIHGEDILEEACEFSKTQLKFLVNQLNPSFATQINHCLRKPFQKSLLRFEAKYHMTIYEQDSCHNKTLLTFAKVDFNILQKMHQKEIGTITKWWNKSNFVKKVPYARNRSVECFIWILAMSYKPEDGNGRIFGGKLTSVTGLLDDTYDNYGTVQELEIFTEAIQRWDKSLLESLPQCMKEVFDVVVELCEEMELLTSQSAKSRLVVPNFKQAICNITKAYMIEAKWGHEGYVPTYDEYKVNGILTSCGPLFYTTFIGLGEFATDDVFDWISSDPNIIEAASLIARLTNDMASHKFERQRIHVASSVDCCMMQYGISEEEAYNFIRKDIEYYWKVINETCLNPKDIPKSVLDCIINYARMSELSYENHLDRFTNGELLKDVVSSLLLDPM